MTVLISQQATTFDGAARLVLGEAGVDRVSSEIMTLVAVVVDPARLRPTAQIAVAGAIRRRWARANFSEWARWYVAVPRLKYDAWGIPALVLETQIFVVACGKAHLPTGTSYRVTAVEAAGKPERQLLPLNILHSLATGSCYDYTVLERDGLWVTLNMAGFQKGIKLHSGLVEGIRQALRHHSVDSWLRSFGPQGETIAPHVVGYLLGFLLKDGDPRSLGQQNWSLDQLKEAVKKLGYSDAEADKVIKPLLPRLAAARDLEAALRLVLESLGH